MSKRKNVWWLVLSVCLLAVLFTRAEAQEPSPPVNSSDEDAEQRSILTYQGVLMDKDDNPVETAVQMVFRLYDAAGTLHYTSTTHTVMPVQGQFTTYIGESPDPVLNSGVLNFITEVGVTVGDDAEMSPRQPLHTVLGVSATGIGVSGNSTSGTGVYGKSFDGVGVVGYGINNYGISGHSHHYDGVYGFSIDGIGTSGHSLHHIGVYGASETGIGVSGYTSGTQLSDAAVYGENDGAGAGVYGESADGAGVSGYSPANAGVFGWSENGYGISGHSNNLTGVYGYSIHGTAGYFSATDPATATAIFINDSSSQVLHLRNGGAEGADSDGSGGGHFIEAVNGDGQDVQFRVTTSGTVQTDGAYTTPAGDFAEMLPAVSNVEPGDVLVVGVDGTLRCSTAAYQVSVVGVYATQSGFIGGMGLEGAADGEIPLAIMGVVPVKVSAENGAIRPGDLLVTSSTTGHAMRAGDNPPIGTVVGKALGALSQETGVIQMLVTLQ